MDGQSNLELDRPRSATEILGATFRLYGRYPLLFPILAAAVVVPYLVVVLLITGDGPFEYRDNLSFVPRELLMFSELILVWPLISALHVHAVRDVVDGNEPRLGDVARRGLVALPVVSAAVAISWIATVAGFLALVVPGVILWLRWSVVAQAAALGDGGWIDALRRSAELARGNYLHVFGLILLVTITTGMPSFLIGLPFHHSDPTVGSFLIGAVVQILSSSFGALATAILYFDLTARLREGARATVVPEPGTSTSPSEVPSGPGDPLTPDGYTDQDRPAGWYIDPEAPARMRYWGAGGRSWSKRTAKTPNQTLEEWRALGDRR